MSFSKLDSPFNPLFYFPVKKMSVNELWDLACWGALKRGRKERKGKEEERNNHHHSFPIQSQATSQTKKRSRIHPEGNGRRSHPLLGHISTGATDLDFFKGGRRQERRRRRLKCLLRKTLTAGKKTAEEEEFLQRPFSGSREMDAGDLSVFLFLFENKGEEEDAICIMGGVGFGKQTQKCLLVTTNSSLTVFLQWCCTLDFLISCSIFFFCGESHTPTTATSFSLQQSNAGVRQKRKRKRKNPLDLSPHSDEGGEAD